MFRTHGRTRRCPTSNEGRGILHCPCHHGSLGRPLPWPMFPSPLADKTMAIFKAVQIIHTPGIENSSISEPIACTTEGCTNRPRSTHMTTPTRDPPTLIHEYPPDEHAATRRSCSGDVWDCLWRRIPSNWMVHWSTVSYLRDDMNNRRSNFPVSMSGKHARIVGPQITWLTEPPSSSVRPVRAGIARPEHIA